MLIDDITIHIRAGAGGNGAVAFDKNKLALGPAGGNGGRGGSVYMEGVADIGALRQFRYEKNVAAENGEHGRAQFVDGKDGADTVLRIPVGTVIHNLDTNVDMEITSIGERIVIAGGGRGGKGNFKFRSPTNTTPKEFQPGGKGESYTIRLELKLIADVGFIGFPNVGKSSLLNELTHAKAKIANYQFTTLEPNLGAFEDLILADIPGLIEGASSGKGLGMQFLRHIERTRTLFHLVRADADDPLADYHAVRKELGMYNKSLCEKEEYILLSHADTVSAEQLKDVERLFLTAGMPSVYTVSLLDEESLSRVRSLLYELSKRKHVNL